MKITGDNVVPHPVERVWDALLDPRVLVRTIPGCERLEETGEHTYAMTVTAGVAAIKGTYSGSCSLADLEPHRSLTMRLQGSGAPGTVDATVAVSFQDAGEGSTRIAYDADAVVGGMVGGVGQRMLASVSRRMAAEFFGNVASAIGGGGAADALVTEPAAATGGGATAGEDRRMPAVYAATPGLAPSAASRTDFLQGVALGAGLVLLGVLAGSRLGRRG